VTAIERQRAGVEFLVERVLGIVANAARIADRFRERIAAGVAQCTISPVEIQLETVVVREPIAAPLAD